MNTTTVVVVVVVLVVLVLLALGVVALLRKRTQQRRVQADQLRTQAAHTAAEQPGQAARVEQTEARAADARAEAERLEREAREARTALDQTRAQHEDAVREADRLDPDVDHRADGYRPDLETPREVSDAAADADRQVTGAGTAAPETDVRRPTDPHDPDFDAGPGTGRGAV